MKLTFIRLFLYRKECGTLKKSVISLVSGRQTTDALRKNLTRDLQLVFGDSIEIEDIMVSSLGKQEQVTGDVILATYPGVVRQLKGHVSDMKKSLSSRVRSQKK